MVKMLRRPTNKPQILQSFLVHAFQFNEHAASSFQELRIPLGRTHHRCREAKERSALILAMRWSNRIKGKS